MMAEGYHFRGIIGVTMFRVLAIHLVLTSVGIYLPTRTE
jgi:hypothetical protein